MKNPASHPFLRFASKLLSLLALGMMPGQAPALAALELIPPPPSAPYPIFLGGARREWRVFEGRKPYAQELRLKFHSSVNQRERTLLIRQDDVKQDWNVMLNGKTLGPLFLMEADLIQSLAIPPQLLREGENELRIYAKAEDDIVIHSISIADDTRTNLLSAGPLTVTVTDANGSALPARITILDENGTLVPVRTSAPPEGESSGSRAAVRPGVAYLDGKPTRLWLLPGRYNVYATRGSEYSLAEARVTVGRGPQSVSLTLSREVDTAGWIASDTHIHTLEISRHGDASVNERVLTLAGEGIELPIVTEHNIHADYSPAARDLGLSGYFTIVPGNEVTTTNAHFNVFPVSLGSPPVDHTVVHWPTLIDNIRKSPGVQVVILNHPMDTHNHFTPFAITNLNPLTGKNLRGDFEFTFDAMEVINSGAMRTDWMEPFRAWFALLNRGYKVTGVGSSDCHDVSRFIVGQGRTYIQADDSDPGRIDIPKACEALKKGRAVASLGLFPSLTISDFSSSKVDRALKSGNSRGSGPGDLHRAKSDSLEITATVDFPGWMKVGPRSEMIIYANGRAVHTMEIPEKASGPRRLAFRTKRPKSDTWYVLVASCAGVTNAYWSIARPYQPSSPDWDPRMIGATNPIYVDADGDGRFTSPHSTAESLVETLALPEKVLEVLADYDWATAVQAAELLDGHPMRIASGGFQQHLRKAAPAVRAAFGEYMDSVSRADKQMLDSQ